MRSYIATSYPNKTRARTAKESYVFWVFNQFGEQPKETLSSRNSWPKTKRRGFEGQEI